MFNRFIPKSTFAKHTSILLIGTVIAQAIPVVCSPILTRIYLPEDFGSWTLFISVASLFNVIATARYELAIVLPEKDDDAYQILGLSIGISLLMGVITALLLLVLTYILLPAISGIVGTPISIHVSSVFFFLIPIMVILTGIYNSFNYWSTRQKTYKKNALSRIALSVSNMIIALVLGYYFHIKEGLVWGLIVGQMVALFILIAQNTNELNILYESLRWEKIRKNMKEYSNLPKYNSPHAFLDIVHNNIIIFFVEHFFGKHMLGLYGFTFRILKTPASLIGSAASQVFFQQASKMHSEGKDLRNMLWNIYKKLLIAGVPAFVFLILFAPAAFAFFFGEEWRMAGIIAQCISPWLFFNYLLSPVATIAIIKNKQKQAMFITLLDVVLKVIMLVIGGTLADYKLTFILISFSSSMVLIGVLFWYHSIATK